MNNASRRFRLRRPPRLARLLRFELLEDRRLLASDWQNPLLPYDVNDTSSVTPLDALLLINDLNRNGSRSITETFDNENLDLSYVDVNGDGSSSPIDVLSIINYLNSPPAVLPLQLRLVADTGTSPLDAVTKDGRVAAALPGGGAVFQSLKARVDRGPVVELAPGGGTELLFDVAPLVSGLAGSATGKPVTVKVFGAGSDGSSSLRRLQLTLDITPPASTLNLSAETDTGVLGDGITAIDRPRLAGRSEPGAVVEVFEADVSLGTCVADQQTGEWAVPLAMSLADGWHEISMQATDAAGNIGLLAVPFSLRIDTRAPQTPHITYPGAGEVSGPQPVVRGFAEPASEVFLYDRGAILGSVTTAANGEWAFPCSTPLTRGEHAISAEARDSADSRSSLSNAVEITVNTGDFFNHPYASYVKFSAIRGDVTETAYKDWVAISEYHFGVSRPIPDGATGVGRTRGTTSLDDLILSGPLDSSAPALAQASALGTYLNHVDFAVMALINGRVLPVLEYHLHEVIITSHALAGLGQAMTLNFTNVEWTYTKYDALGNTLRRTVDSYDPRTGTGTAGGAADATLSASAFGDPYASYVRLPGVAGDVTEANHLNWIEVSEYRSGVSRSVPDGVNGSQRTQGTTSLGELELIGPLDSSAPKLAQFCATGYFMQTVDFAVMALIDGRVLPVLEYTLHHVIVSAHTMAGLGQGLTLNFVSVEWTYTKYDASGQSLGPSLGSYDTEAALAEGEVPAASPRTVTSWAAGEFASPYASYVKFSAIRGDVTETAYKDWVAISEYHFGVSRPIPDGATGVGRTRGTTSLDDLILSGPLDSSAPALAQASALGTYLNHVDFAVMALINGRVLPVLEYHLHEVIITSHALAGLGQAMTLNFTNVEWTYTKYDALGNTLRRTVDSYDPRTGTGTAGGAADATLSASAFGDPYASYVRLPGVAGDVTEANHLNWIEVSEYRSGVSRSVPDGVNGSQRTQGTTSLGELELIGPLDSSAPKLAQFCATGYFMQTVDFAVMALIDGRVLPVLEYTLHHVIVSAHTMAGLGQGLTLNFVSVEWTYTKYDASGQSLGPSLGSYDTEAALAEGEVPAASPRTVTSWAAGEFASPYASYVKFSAIRGDVTETAYKDWVAISEYHFGVSRPIPDGATGVGRTRGTTSLDDLILSGPLDSSAPALAQASALGTYLNHVDFAVMALINGRVLPVLEYHLHEVIITSHALAGLGQAMTLNFTNVEWTYTKYDALGNTLRRTVDSYDPRTGTGTAGGAADATLSASAFGDPYASYVRLPGVAGDVTEANHLNWIEVSEYRSGVSRSVPDGVNGSQRTQGTTSLGELELIGPLDSSAPKLAQFCATGYFMQTVDFAVMALIDGRVLPVLEYTLHKVIITSHTMAGLGQGLTLNFASVEWTYTKYDASGQSLGQSLGSYDTEAVLAEGETSIPGVTVKRELD